MVQRLITPPTVLAVTLERAKLNLKVDGADLDALITMWVEGITAALEHEIGQCLMPQTWLVSLDAFPAAIVLPHPVISVTSVTYLDRDGDVRTLEPAAYKINRGAYRSTLAPIAGTSWPDTFNDSNVIDVTVVCGYGPTADSTPANVRLYILAKLVEQFDPATRTERDTVQSTFIDRLLDACRSYA